MCGGNGVKLPWLKLSLLSLSVHEHGWPGVIDRGEERSKKAWLSESLMGGSSTQVVIGGVTFFLLFLSFFPSLLLSCAWQCPGLDLVVWRGQGGVNDLISACIYKFGQWEW